MLKLYRHRFTVKEIIRYLRGQETLPRMLQDAQVKEVLPLITGKVLELGASANRSYYADLCVNAQEYVKSNLYPDNEAILKIDATDTGFPDSSFDGVICMNVMEHIENFRAVMSEIERILVPGGKAVLGVPFMFRYHAAPNDYYRFSASALEELFKNFSKVEICQLGCRYHAIADIMQSIRYSGGKKICAGLGMRLLGLAFLPAATSKKKTDDYALFHTVFAEK